MKPDLLKIVGRLRDHLGVDSDASVAEALKMKRSALYNHKVRGSIPYEHLSTYCGATGLSLDWLLYGRGKAGDTASEPERAAVITDGQCLEGKGYAYVPLVTGEIGAGGGLEADNTIDMRLAFRADWLRRKGDPAKMSLIRVRGDSMEPTLYSGDLVLVDHNKTHVEMSGGIYAIQYNHGISIKRLRLDYATRRVQIVSDNAAKYPVMDAAEKDVIVNGKVIWYGRELEP
jgi:phage repressor protein C with HTH and peptisase S24 domain